MIFELKRTVEEEKKNSELIRKEKVTTHHHWVLASRDLVLEFFKKFRSSRVISWP
jgi:hypothetical protein